MSETKRKNFMYKRASFLKETGDAKMNLEMLLRQAIKKVPKAIEREKNPDEAVFQLINYSGSHTPIGSKESLFGCEFLSFEQGADQSTIKINGDSTEMDIRSLVAANGEEFLDGSVYFGVISNHVVIVQSTALRTKDLEDYLNWFLTIKAKVLGDDNRVTLGDFPPKNVDQITGIEVGGNLKLEHKKANYNRPGHGKPRTSFPLTYGGTAWKLVKTMFADGFDLPTGLDVDDLTEVPKIEMRLYLKWKGTTPEEESSLLNSIAKNMSHIGDEFDYKIHTKTGQIGREKFKIEQDHSFTWSKGRPEFHDLFPKMAKWLAGLIECGKVDP